MNKSRKKGKTQLDTSKETRISTRKKFFFAIVVNVVFFVIVEFMCWAAGVVPANKRSDPYQGFVRHFPHFVEEFQSKANSSRHLKVSDSKSTVLNPTRFSASKEANSYRIVCLGGSTTYGRPFFDLTSFPGWLRGFLPSTDPTRSWEVINAGAISYASYRVIGLMEELANYSPDLFIVYVGHNEFLERRTFPGLSSGSSLFTALTSATHHTRIATLIQDSLTLLPAKQDSKKVLDPLLGEKVKSIPVDAVGPEAYTRDERLAKRTIKEFQFALREMIRIARKANAEILFITPSSNLSDFAPFKSQHVSGLSESQISRWRGHYDRAQLLFRMNSFADALKEIENAEAIDGRMASLHYQKGRILQAMDRSEQAKDAFIRARDEDICPLRAISPIVDAVRRVAKDKDTLLVDFEKLVDARANNEISGRDEFHDHVHPTIEMNRAMALGIIDSLIARGLILPQESWNGKTIDLISEATMREVNRPLHAQHLRGMASLLASLKQPEQARYQAELSLKLSGRTAAALADLGTRFDQRANSPSLAIAYYQEAVQVDPTSGQLEYLLGRTHLKLKQNEAAEKHLRRAVALQPKVAEYQTLLGVVLARLKRLDDSIDCYRLALHADPQHFMAHYYWGRSLEVQGKHQQARSHYQQVLAINSRHKEAQQGLMRLKQ